MDPVPVGAAIARVALKSSPVVRRVTHGPPDERAHAPRPDEGVLGRMVDELLSDVVPAPREDCDAHRRRIDELEAVVRTKEKRIAELEANRADDGGVRQELESVRTQAARLTGWITRLTRERDDFEVMAREAQEENQRLSSEVARLQKSLDALKRLGS